MDFYVIDPARLAVETVKGKITDAYAAAGLSMGQVDHGSLYRDEDGWTINIIVYEFGLKKPPEEGHYFAIGKRLYEGPAVIYAADPYGETMSLEGISKPPVTFYRSHVEVEAAIQRGELDRPEMAVNGMVLWSWGRRG